MKSNILLTLCLTLMLPGFLIAQSFSVPNPSYAYWGNLNTNTASVHIPVTNNASINLDVIVEKTQNSLAGLHQSLFCFGIQCYDSSANSSAIISFAGDSTEILIADLNKNGTLGLSCVTYRIKDINNTSDFVDVEVCYHITPTGISTIPNTSTLSLPQPNPADRFAAVTYNLAGDNSEYTIAVYDILGSLVKQVKFSEKSGILLLPTAELNAGVYFCSLQVNNKTLGTNKLIVAH